MPAGRTAHQGVLLQLAQPRHFRRHCHRGWRRLLHLLLLLHHPGAEQTHLVPTVVAVVVGRGPLQMTLRPGLGDNISAPKG